MDGIRQGGCLCGAVRYEIDLTDGETGNCHCKDCQKHHGAPYATFTSVDASQITWLTKKPDGEAFASKIAVRRFCSQCGTPMVWDGRDSPDRCSISTATLDDPSGIPVTYEIFTQSRMMDVPAVSSAKQFKGEG